MKRLSFLLLFLMLAVNAIATTYTRQDSLRGSNGRGRSWWDVQKYDLQFEIDTFEHVVYGQVRITFKVTNNPTDSMQIDLQEGMELITAVGQNAQIDIQRDGNVFWLKAPFSKLVIGEVSSLFLPFRGKPRNAVNPPWDGGFIWTHDSTGKQWIAVACQGLGASAWWPCKDYQGDEPDSGMTFNLTVRGDNNVSNKTLFGVENGRMLREYIGEPLVNEDLSSKTNSEILIENSTPRTWEWQVKNPINTYNATFYLGDYAHWKDTINGEKGALDLDFYPLKYNEAKAREQFKQAKQMLHCFEYWMGPYPFYEDGYKLVEAPYLGMEHQSAIAYGNQYKMGYKGTDRSGTDIGMYFDYIIIHESGHEWFGNNITAQDVADNWIHEGFTTYTETLFTECLFNKDSAFKFMRGEWRNIRNDRPVIGDYGVNDDGSSDKYDKGAAVIHMIRVMMNDDEKFRQLLRGLNKDFYHKIVTSAQVEDYIIKYTGLDLKPLFDQYLRTTKIPELEYFMIGRKLKYRFINTVDGFTLPITVEAEDQKITITPDRKWHKVKWKGGKNIQLTQDFLYTQRYVLE